MGFKTAIISLIKKIRCKCNCIGGFEIELMPDNNNNLNNNNLNNNNNNLNVENNINVSTPNGSPLIQHRPLPHIYTELV